MHENSASRRTLYPYERRRRGRWRFGGSLVVLAMLSLATAPAGAVPGQHLLAPIGDPIVVDPGVSWTCRDLGEREYTMRGFHDWIFYLSGVYLGTLGKVEQITRLSECQNDLPCRDSLGDVQTIGFFTVEVTSLTVSDDVATLYPFSLAKNRHEFTCYNKDQVTRTAYREAYRMQDVAVCAHGHAGNHRVEGLLEIDVEQPLWPYRADALYTIKFQGTNGCGVSLATLSGQGAYPLP